MENYILEKPMTLKEIEKERKSVQAKKSYLLLAIIILWLNIIFLAISIKTVAIGIAFIIFNTLLSVILTLIHHEYRKDENKLALLKPGSKEIAFLMEMATKQEFEEIKTCASKIAKLDRLPTQGEYAAFEKWISNAKERNTVNELKALC